MRRIYWVFGLLAILPALDSAGCSCGGDSSNEGKNGGAGGVQDFAYTIEVSWTIQGNAANADNCAAIGATDLRVTLSGTVDIDLHKDKSASCTDGKVTFTNLTRLGTGSDPYIDGALLTKDGIAIFDAGVDVTPAAGTVSV